MSLLALPLALFVSLLPAPEREVQMRYVMGTLWTIEAEGPGARSAVEGAFGEVKRLDALWSHYKTTSEVARINREAPRGWTPVSAETFGLLERSLGYARASNGAFDPTVGPLVRLWGFKHDDYRVPTPAEIAGAKAKTGYARIALDARRGVSFTHPALEVEFGAIAKGTAVDAALNTLVAAGMTLARVDAGGNQRVFGGLTPWRFGLKHPREAEAVVTTLELSEGAIATSGDAERGFWHDGVRYGHILDPRTGWPARGLLSVTVTASTAEEADALSTTLYVLGLEKGREHLKRYPGATAIFVTDQGLVKAP